uniref:ATP synthase F0 subunit 8 n=1 Tax=Camponotus ulcerosus TaxID=251258 RepID=Q6VPB5_9HYME|nr:ATP synthase F0 subunit 8 [Camponotus ulcerosus]
MPHMMPMLWMFIFSMTLSFIFFLSSMIYFFYFPSISTKTPKFHSSNNFKKWIWMW